MTETLSRLGAPLNRQRAVLVLVALLAIGNLVNAVRKGGDFDLLVAAGRRVMAASPLYEGSRPGTGVTWPPFEGVFILPFALVADPKIAKVAWHAVSVVALLCGLAWSVAAVAPPSSPASREHGRRTPLAPALVPLLAILLPLQTNFQHQNLNTVLLAIVAAGMLCLRRGRDVTGGALVGVATALKAFPGLLIVTLLAERAWLAAGSAIAVAAAATLSPALFYGASESMHQLRAWLALNRHGGWPIEAGNQSLLAMVYRLVGREGTPGNGHVYATTDPFPYWLAAGLAIALVAALIAVVARTRRSPGAPVAEARPAYLAVALALAVLLSPIAWDHYWVLMFPALYVLYDRGREMWHRVVFWLCALLTSGLSRVTVGAGGLAVARELSAFTVAGLLLVVTILVMLSARAAARGGVDPVRSA